MTNRRYNRRLPLAIAACSSLLALSCGQPFGPLAPDGDVMRMEMSVSSPSGDPSHPITVRTRVTNLGRKTLGFFRECNDPSIARLSDPESRHVHMVCGNCPIAVCLDCTGYFTQLHPGESLEEEIVFSGELRDCNGTFQGPTGEYRADAAVTAKADGSEYTASKSVKFTWTAEP